MTDDDPGSGAPPATVPGPPALWGIVAAGGLVGLAIAATARIGEVEPEGSGLAWARSLATALIGEGPWLVWAVFAAGLTGTAALTGVIGWRSWQLVGWACEGGTRSTRHLPRDLSLVVVLLAGLVVYGTLLDPGSYRGTLLVACTLLGGAPAVAAMAEARRALSDPHDAGGLRRPPFDAIVELRLLLRRLLVAGGALVALSTLALGAALELAEDGPVAAQQQEQLDQGPDAPTTDEPGFSVLVFGGLGSLIVGLVYVPAAAALRTRIRREVRDRFPLHDDDPPGDHVLQRLRERRELETLLAGEQGIYGELLASIVVLGPLLTSAIQQYVVR